MYRKNTSFWGHSKQKCMIIYQQMMIFFDETLPAPVKKQAAGHVWCPAALHIDGGSQKALFGFSKL